MPTRQIKINPIEIERELCRRSLSAFVRRAWHVLEPATDLIWSWHHDVICDHLEAVTAGDISRLLINVPPGTMKSLLTTVFWPAWEWGPRDLSHLRYVGTSYKHDNALRDNQRMRDLVKSQWFSARWPIDIKPDQDVKSKFATAKTGFRESIAYEGLTAKRGDRLLIDDPHSATDAHRRDQIKNDVQIFTDSATTRINHAGSAIIVIMQRIAVGDVSDVAISLGFDHVCLPMMYETGRSKWSVGRGDPRTVDGQLLSPKQFPQSRVDEINRTMTDFAVASQMQQRPTIIGGNIVKGNWFPRYHVLPPLKYRMIYGDTAETKKTHSDYCVFTEVGLGADGRLYVLDMVRKKMETPEMRQTAIDFWGKCRARDHEVYGPLRQMRVEKKSSGTALVQEMSITGQIIISGIERNSDRYTRVSNAMPSWKQGLVLLPAEASWTHDLIEELEEFTATDTHRHDDQIDTLADATTEMIVINPVTTWSQLCD